MQGTTTLACSMRSVALTAVHPTTIVDKLALLDALAIPFAVRQRRSKSHEIWLLDALVALFAVHQRPSKSAARCGWRSWSRRANESKQRKRTRTESRVEKGELAHVIGGTVSVRQHLLLTKQVGSMRSTALTSVRQTSIEDKCATHLCSPKPQLLPGV